MLYDDLISQEPCCLSSTVGYKRLGCREFQLEGVTQELANLLLDRPASTFGPTKPSKKSSAYRMYRKRR